MVDIDAVSGINWHLVRRVGNPTIWRIIETQSVGLDNGAFGILHITIRDAVVKT